MAGSILVRDVMTTGVKTVTLDSTIAEAVKKMNKFGIGAIIVVQGKKPVGIITERDILMKIVEPFLDPKLMKVRQVMSSPLITIRGDALVEEAANVMTEKSIKKLPVVLDEQLIGIVTTTDLVEGPEGD